MTPKEISEQAQKLWDQQKEDFGYPPEHRMSFVMGVTYALHWVNEKEHSDES